MKTLHAFSPVITVLFSIFLISDALHGRNRTIPPVMIADFEDESVLELTDISGVESIKLTEKDAVTGKRALEVHVLPYAVHKNGHPRIVFGKKYIKTPIDGSRYTHITTTIRNVTEGLAGVKVNMTSLPYNDGGRNLDETYWEIPEGESMQCDFPMTNFPNPVNDPSQISLIMILFPDNEVDATYRIDAIQAVYDPAAGSPVESLLDQAVSVKRQLGDAMDKVDWNSVPQALRTELQPKFTSHTEEVSKIQMAAEKGLTAGLGGTYNTHHERMILIERQLSQLRLAEKKDFFAWEISRYINVFRDERVDYSHPEVESIDVALALDEYRDKVFMVSSCGKDLRLGVEVIPGKGLPAEAIWVREALYINFKPDIDALGDALYDLQGPLLVPKNECRQVWITVNTRYSGLQPGEYDFQVVLTDLDTGTRRTIPGSVTVWDFQLPNYDSLANNGYVELFNSEVGLKIRDKAVNHMKMYGLNIVLVYWNYMPWPVDVDADGNIINFNTASLEGEVRPVVEAWNKAPGNNNRLTFLLHLGNAPTTLLKRKDITHPSEQWADILGRWVTKLKKAMNQMGVPDEDIVLFLADESNMTVLLNFELPLAEMIMARVPGTRIMTNRGPGIPDKESSFRFYKTFDSILSRGERDAQYPYLQEWIDQGGRQPELWTYRANYMAPRYKNLYGYYRIYGWENFAWGITGPGVWTYCARVMSPWNESNKEMIGHGLVFKHKDKDEVVHSRRYEFYREGVDDYRYLMALRALAAEKGPDALAKVNAWIDRAYADISSDVTDTTRCDKWRLQAAKKIMALKGKASVASVMQK